MVWHYFFLLLENSKLSLYTRERESETNWLQVYARIIPKNVKLSHTNQVRKSEELYQKFDSIALSTGFVPYLWTYQSWLVYPVQVFPSCHGNSRWWRMYLYLYLRTMLFDVSVWVCIQASDLNEWECVCGALFIDISMHTCICASIGRAIAFSHFRNLDSTFSISDKDVYTH